MKNLILFGFLFPFFFGGCPRTEINTITSSDEIVILVSIDGFRYDYFEKTSTPTFDQLASEGTVSKGLIPVFPSKTFPNHLSIVTGLYPENHGIISNNIYNHETGERYRIGAGSTSVSESKWYLGEPIWVTAEKQGLRAATFFWPGSEAEINGHRPTYWNPYDGSIPNKNRVRQVLKWLDLPENERPRFISLYFSDTDDTGHQGGPDAPMVTASIQKVDGEIGLLIKGIKDRQLDDKVNIIIVSDHGMAQLSRDRVIYLDDYINLKDVMIVDWSPIAAIRPKENKKDFIYNALANKHPNMKVYRKSEIPEELHFSKHPFIQPIICIADEGWSITSHDYAKAHPDAYQGGTHGYDPAYKSMWGIFLAKGPSFQKGMQSEAFQNIHLYELMCEILEISPAKNDGDLNEVSGMLVR